MNMGTVFAALIGLGISLALMIVIWAFSVLRKDASLVDRFWGLGFVLLAWFWWAVGPQYLAALVPVVLVTLWGLRLSLYLSWRNWGEGEDRRYQAMRERHGDGFAKRSLWSVFLLQGAILWLVAYPFLMIGLGHLDPALMQWWGSAGILLWVIGFFLETTADFQLARFKSDPENRGRVMDQGLWRYSRHPNYFGEICVWWGFYCFAIPFGGWWTLFAPVLMTFLLVRVSGVTLLERDLKASKPEYADYVRRTSALIPWPPREGRDD